MKSFFSCVSSRSKNRSNQEKLNDDGATSAETQSDCSYASISEFKDSSDVIGPPGRFINYSKLSRYPMDYGLAKDFNEIPDQHAIDYYGLTKEDINRIHVSRPAKHSSQASENMPSGSRASNFLMNPPFEEKTACGESLECEMQLLSKPDIFSETSKSYAQGESSYCETRSDSPFEEYHECLENVELLDISGTKSLQKSNTAN